MANAQILSPERLRMLQRNPDFVTDREVVALAEELAAAKAENAEILNALTALLEAPDDKAVRGLAAMVRDCPSLRAAVFLREYVARRERAEALEAERDALRELLEGVIPNEIDWAPCAYGRTPREQDDIERVRRGRAAASEYFKALAAEAAKETTMADPQGTVFLKATCKTCGGTGKSVLPPRCSKHGCSLVCDTSDMDMDHYCPACKVEGKLIYAQAEAAELLAALTSLLEQPNNDRVRGAAIVVRDCPTFGAKVFLDEYLARFEHAKKADAENVRLRAIVDLVPGDVMGRIRQRLDSTRATAEAEGRCRVCGWPLAKDVEGGCTKESCSMRSMRRP